MKQLVTVWRFDARGGSRGDIEGNAGKAIKLYGPGPQFGSLKYLELLYTTEWVSFWKTINLHRK